jgi:phage terminase large subunit
VNDVRIEIPPKLIPIFEGEARYRGAYGGRGSGKTMTFAKMSAVRAYMFGKAGIGGVILCGREFMNSLEDSSMEEVKQAIRSERILDAYFDIGEKYIRSIDGRIEYKFVGLRNNLDSVKSKARILIAWVDEAENVSEVAWQKLIPTVRTEESEIWVTWNPERNGSPTDLRFRRSRTPDMLIAEMNYPDNPWFPSVLERERQNDLKRLDDATYRWIWEGAYRENSAAQVFAGKYEMREFVSSSDWNGPYQGIDFGFSKDPTAAIRCWIHDSCLWIEHEAVKVNLELDQTTGFILSRIPAFDRYVTRADSARPESISYLRRYGLPRVVPAQKGKGSIEDGISFIKSFRKVYIHPRCKETLNEFRNYSYKVDRLSGDILPDVVDAFNHSIDSLRYSLEPIMKNRRSLNIRI